MIRIKRRLSRKHIQQFSKRNSQGSALMFTIIVTLILSVLGMTLLVVSSSHLRMNVHARDYQSVYYIAEAGINQRLSKFNQIIDETYASTSSQNEFFSKLEEKMTVGSSLVIDQFEKVNGHTPKATITVNQKEKIDDYTRVYSITSLGAIDSQKRKLTTDVKVRWVQGKSGGFFEENFVYGHRLQFDGKHVEGKGASVVIHGNIAPGEFNGGANFEVSNLFVGGNMTIDKGGILGSSEQPGKIYIKEDLTSSGERPVYGDMYIGGKANISGHEFNGDIYIQGDATIENTTFKGNVYVHGNATIENGTISKNLYVGGNLILKGNPSLHGFLEYKGNLAHPDAFSPSQLAKISKKSRLTITMHSATEEEFRKEVFDFVIPKYVMSLQSKQWYEDKDYTMITDTKNQTLSNGMKAYSEEDFYMSPLESDYRDITIISKNGDIELTGKNSKKTAPGKLLGKCVLIAPNGNVKFAGTEFEGVVISKEGLTVYSGGNTIRFKKLNDIFASQDMPIIVDDDSIGGGTPESGGTGFAQIETVKGIREQ